MSYSDSIGWAHHFRQRRIDAMQCARAARARSALAPISTEVIVRSWVRVARMESVSARLHFKRARSAQLDLLKDSRNGL